MIEGAGIAQGQKDNIFAYDFERRNIFLCYFPINQYSTADCHPEAIME